MEEVPGFVFSGQEVNFLSNTNVLLFFYGFVKEDKLFPQKLYISHDRSLVGENIRIYLNHSKFYATNINEYSTLRNRRKLILKHSRKMASLVVWWSELLTNNHEVPGSISGSTRCVFP